jgi:hypothetical protein
MLQRREPSPAALTEPIAMIRAVSKTAEEQAQSAFRDAQQLWRGALEAHRLAPPDAGFSVRLSALADAARAEAEACRVADGAGFDWPPHRASSSAPPYELQPGSGRRGSWGALAAV